MEAERTRTRWTYAEFARLPSEGSTRYEIIADELYVTPSPSPRHQRVVTDLVSLLNEFVRSHDLGHLFVSPLDVLFAEGDYVEPDLLFVRRDRAGILTDRGVEGAPDLVVEVLSPSSRDYDRDLKRKRYLENGVAEVWIADADERWIEVWRPGREEPIRPVEAVEWEVEGETFSLSLEEVFRGSELV